MSNYRMISTGFWDDTKVKDEFTPEDKYFYLYLLTNPHTNICGCYEIGNKSMEQETGYNLDTVKRLLQRMTAFNVIRYSPQTKEILILNWSKHNWTKSDKMRKAVESVLKYVKSDRFREYLEASVAEKFDGIQNKNLELELESESESESELELDVSIGYTYPMDTVSKSDDSRKKKPTKHKCGECANVLLTDAELKELIDRFPDYQAKIDNLSRYLKQTGKRYASHYQTILNWARKDAERPAKKSSNPFLDALEEYE